MKWVFQTNLLQQLHSCVPRRLLGVLSACSPRNMLLLRGGALPSWVRGYSPELQLELFSKSWSSCRSAPNHFINQLWLNFYSLNIFIVLLNLCIGKNVKKPVSHLPRGVSGHLVDQLLPYLTKTVPSAHVAELPGCQLLDLSIFPLLACCFIT